jgi:peptide/nickel transport system permease protein
MRSYIIRRLLLAVPTVLLISLIIFFMIRLIPGDVIDAMAARLSAGGGGTLTVNRAALEHSLGMDVPIFTQYGRWLGVVPGPDGGLKGLFQGYLGTSLLERVPVHEQIRARWPITLELSFLGLIIAQLIALPIGIYSALRQETWADYAGRSFAILCIAVPYFWLATMAIVFFSMWWGYMPPLRVIPFFQRPLRNLRMFLLPAFILGVAISGTTMRMTRTMMLEVLRQDYIRTAWSKGLKEKIVVTRHALKNALIPIVTIVGSHLPTLIGGTVIIETIFLLPGMGRLLVEATQYRDYPVVSGVMILFGVGLVLINLAVDLTYAYLDPRIRYK